MAEDKDDKRQVPQQGFGLAIGIGCGVAIGTSLGVAMDNIAIGTSMGIALGVVFGLALDAAFKKKREAKEDEALGGGSNET